ncbi:MAG: BACON domain-containing protein [Bacteroidales bacterium]|nr:BACON domain-containing protein [Bacteroidales bacterium]
MRKTILFFVLLLGVFACSKPYELQLPLAVDSKNLIVKADEGFTNIMVYSTEAWTASLPADAWWLSLENASGKGDGAFIARYGFNDGLSRKTTITLSTGSRSINIDFMQRGEVTSPALAFAEATQSLCRIEADCSIPLLTNLSTSHGAIRASVTYPEDAEDEWMSNLHVEGGNVCFSVSANGGTKARTATLTVQATDPSTGETTSASTTVNQSTAAPQMKFPASSTTVEGFDKDHTVNFNSNLGGALAYIEFDTSAEWITEVRATNSSFTFHTLANEAASTRSATLNVAYTSPDGTYLGPIVLRITQGKAPVEVSFETLRSKLSGASSITLTEGYIEGIAIHDPKNANLEFNPQTTWQTVDTKENDKTAYIQSLDGNYGLRLKFTSADYNNLPKSSKVKISLSGLTLKRENSPVRYTLSGITPNSVVSTIVDEEIVIPIKERTIAGLSDADVYTYVTLKDCEFPINYGSYGNMHDAFATYSDIVVKGNPNQCRCDCCPRLIRDVNAKTMYLLLNAQTPWRRAGRVPQGSGRISGILVHSELPRWGGNIGTYQLRPLSLEDFDMTATENEGFSAKLVAWEGFTSAMSYSGTKIFSKLGSGTMNTSCETAAVGRTTSFCGESFETPTGTWAPRYSGQWPKDTWISWTFSTENIKGSGRHLSLMMTCGLGNMTADQLPACPIYWDIQYSSDGGSNFTTLKSKVKFYHAPVYAYQHPNQPANNPEYVFELPDACLGKNSVVVRMKVNSNTCMNANGVEAALNTSISGVYIRFDEVCIRYNR